MPGRRRTPAERTIIFGSALAGLTREQANELLGTANFREVPKSTYDMVCRSYVPHFRASSERLRECIYAPKPMGVLGLEPLDDDEE